MTELSFYWRSVITTFALGTLLAVAVLSWILAAMMPGIDKWNRRFFIWFFALLTLDVVAYTVEFLAIGHPSMILLVKASGCLESVLPAVHILMVVYYLLHCCGEDYRTSTLLRAAIGIWFVYLAILVIAQFTTIFYYYTPDGQFVLGPWYPAGMIPVIALLVLCTVGVIRRRDKLSERRFHALLVFLIPLAVAILTHLFIPVYLLVDIGITASALSMFFIVIFEQIEQDIQLQQEIAEQRGKIAVLQMRPHFIHNTMTSIYYLCEQDPRKAQQVTMDFNTYLRKNFNAIAKDDTIPFSEELEHTRAYLAVEQAQFESKLVIDFHIAHTQFRVPPLTLQPLAENAVKHGMNPQTVPLRVTIKTRKVGSGSEIIVEDNGPGFDHAVADDPHTTLAVIRLRLERMCKGRLEFESPEGGGTVARVIIP